MDADLVKQFNAVREAETRCSQQVSKAGTAGKALIDLIRQAGQHNQHLVQTTAGADAAAQRVAEQRESARATIERQQMMRDQEAALLEQMQQRATEAHKLVARLAESQTDAIRACEELSQRTDRAAQTAHEIDRHIEAADARKEILSASEQTLADFVEQAEMINQQLQRVQRQADAFEVRVNQLIDKPAEITAEAKTQAAQLQEVCRAVRKVFAGLSDAALQAKQRTDEFHQASRAAETRADRLVAETARAAETLRTWVGEATRAQKRLAEYLERCPGLERTHPSESLRGLAGLVKPPGQPARSVLKRIESIEPVSAKQAVQSSGLTSDRTSGHRNRAEEIAHLLQDAHKFAETAG